MRSAIPLFALAFTAAVPALATENVPVPAFRSIELRGGGQLVIRPGPVQRVTVVEGSAAVTRFRVGSDGQLRIDVCAGRCPQHYRLRVEVQSPHVPDVAVAGGGLIQAAPGFAP